MGTATGIWSHAAAPGQALPAANPMDNSTGSTDSSSSSDSATISANDFLTLLVTEMQNQDPTADTDPNEYINQLVNVNSLEQLISINQNLSTAVRRPRARPEPVHRFLRPWRRREAARLQHSKREREQPRQACGRHALPRLNMLPGISAFPRATRRRNAWLNRLAGSRTVHRSRASGKWPRPMRSTAGRAGPLKPTMDSGGRPRWLAFLFRSAASTQTLRL